MVKRGLQGLSQKPSAGLEHVFAKVEGLDQTAWIVPIERIVPDPTQPRKHFDDETLQDLVNDIKHRGLRSPLTVYKQGETFHIIAGERRYRASKLAGLTDVPVRVIETDNVLEEQLIENLQREDLNPVDEAMAIGRLRDGHHLSLRELASRLNKSKSKIERILKILEMPSSLQEKLRIGEISFHQAEQSLQKPRSKASKTHKVIPTYTYRNRKDGSFLLTVKYKPGQSDKNQLIHQLENLVETLKNS